MSGISIESLSGAVFVPYPPRGLGLVVTPGARVRDWWLATGRCLGSCAWRVRARLRRRFAAADSGMSTAEYAVGTLAACGFAAVLFQVLTGGSLTATLTELLEKALHAT